jgi:hypothetical protein
MEDNSVKEKVSSVKSRHGLLIASTPFSLAATSIENRKGRYKLQRLL